MVVALVLLGVLSALAVHRFGSLDAESKALDAAVTELGGRERLEWNREKLSGEGWLDDAAVFSHVDTDLGADYAWIVGPTAEGGELRFRHKTAALTRVHSTATKAGQWKR